MKTLSIQIKSNEAILVILKKEADGSIVQTTESTKFLLEDHTNSDQVKQFLVQINAAIDTINPDKIVVLARNANAKGKMTPSPISFKLEGIIQLYDKKKVDFIWPQGVTAYLKKNNVQLQALHKYQQDALVAAYMTLN